MPPYSMYDPIQIEKMLQVYDFSVFSFGYFEKNIYLCIDFVTC